MQKVRFIELINLTISDIQKFLSKVSTLKRVKLSEQKIFYETFIFLLNLREKNLIIEYRFLRYDSLSGNIFSTGVSIFCKIFYSSMEDFRQIRTQNRRNFVARALLISLVMFLVTRRDNIERALQMTPLPVDQRSTKM